MERPGSAGVLQRGAEGSLGRALARFVGTRKAHRDGRRKREIKESSMTRIDWTSRPRNPSWYESWTQIKKNGKSLKVHEGDPQHLLKSSKEKNFDVMIFMKYTYCLAIQIAVYRDTLSVAGLLPLI